MIQRTCKRNDAPAAASPIARLDARQPTKRRRLADRAASVCAGGAHRHARCHRRRRPARRPARHQHRFGIAPSFPGILHRTERRCHVRRAHGELVQIGLAQRHRTVGEQALRDRALVRRHEIVQDAATGRGAHTLGAKQILDRQRNSGQRPRTSGSECRVRVLGLSLRQFRRNRNERVQPRVKRGHRIQMRLRQFAR